MDKDKKFSVSTVNRVVYTYIRLLAPTTYPNTGSPPSGRIIEDINAGVKNLRQIYRSDGIMIIGIGNQNGVRSMSDGRSNRGGK